jgi:hypothetical protein
VQLDGQERGGGRRHVDLGETRVNVLLESEQVTPRGWRVELGAVFSDRVEDFGESDIRHLGITGDA